MTQEEKLEEAKRLYETANADQKYVLKSLFPELAESEDERIRKNCIHFLELQKQHHAATFEIEECIAWLEKQGEQKPAWSEEDTAIISRVISIVKWAAYSEHSHPILNDEGATELVEQLKSIKDRVQPQPKQEWSEEDKYYYSIIQYCLNNEKVGKADKENAISWFKSIKDRVQPKVEWSEEEKAVLEGIVNTLEGLYDNASNDTLRDLYKAKINFLKSLRTQNRWKPSKEQIIALRWVLKNVPYCKQKEEISGLLDQIKDL